MYSGKPLNIKWFRGEHDTAVFPLAKVVSAKPSQESISLLRQRHYKECVIYYVLPFFKSQSFQTQMFHDKNYTADAQ